LLGAAGMVTDSKKDSKDAGKMDMKAPAGLSLRLLLALALGRALTHSHTRALLTVCALCRAPCLSLVRHACLINIRTSVCDRSSLRV